MKALRHPFNDALTLTGSVGLALLAIPVIAVLAFVLRAAVFIAIPVALAVGVTLWLTSARFRAWFRTTTAPDATYKGLRLASDVALDPCHAWTRADGANLKSQI